MTKVIRLKEIRNDFSSNFSDLLSLCKIDVEEINLLIAERLDSKVPLIKEIASYVLLSGGKRLRPLLTLACAKMSGYGFKEKEKRHIGLATAVEFIHTATLMHDDVVDESELRRGQPSSNKVWGNKTSVLVGDFLLSRAFQLMAKDKSDKVMKLLSDTSVIISEGEVLEIANDKNPTISEDTYFRVVNGKTASLFSAACQVGGIVANQDNNKIDALETFGTNFGISFQLIDDVLDYSSSPNNIGKNIGDDFKEGKITLPIILAYLRSNKEEKKFWNRVIKNLNQNEGDFQQGIKIINKYNCLEDTIARARHFANISLDSLGIFDENEYKNALLNLVKGSVSRIN